MFFALPPERTVFTHTSALVTKNIPFAKGQLPCLYLPHPVVCFGGLQLSPKTSQATICIVQLRKSICVHHPDEFRYTPRLGLSFLACISHILWSVSVAFTLVLKRHKPPFAPCNYASPFAFIILMNSDTSLVWG
jgi:hypothetical protein